MVILERPLQFLASNIWLPKLVDAIDALRSRGAAVLWLTSDPVLSDPALEGAVPQSPVTQMRWQDEQLKPLDGGVGDE